MYLNLLAGFAALMLVIAIWTTDNAVLIPAVIMSGIFIGINPRASIMLGAPTHGSLLMLMDASTTQELWRRACSNILIISPDAPAATRNRNGSASAVHQGARLTCAPARRCSPVVRVGSGR